jgi:ActR/RegA family two-component response regulator
MPIPVLIVDDEPDFLLTMTSALGRKGFEVKTAATSSEAVKLVDAQAFDFAVVDLKIGDENGVDLVREIKRRQPKIHAVMVTGYPRDETRDEAQQSGADSCISKPVVLTELLHAFASAVRPA